MYKSHIYAFIVSSFILIIYSVMVLPQYNKVFISGRGYNGNVLDYENLNKDNIGK